MSFTQTILNAPRPAAIRTVKLPRRMNYFPSPADWRNETLYFLLVDRFSDGLEAQRSLLDRTNLAAARPVNWRWDLWSQSGGERWQGGNLGGVASKLDYLKNLGITTIWLSPVFKQRGHLNSFHGYGIQDFLDIDPHFGDRKILVDLVALAHSKGMRIILDIIFNHSGENWTYPAHLPGGKFQPHYTSGRHAFGAWRGAQGEDVAAIASNEQGVWPSELQDPEKYTRAGAGNLGAGSIDDPQAEHKRTDFITLKDFNLDHPQLMSELASCFKYWIALCDCDGFRIDTLKHVSFEQARNFCGTIKEFAANLGKSNFFLVGEIAGGDFEQDRYLNVLSRNLNAALDIGVMRITLNQVAKGLQHPADYFAGFNPGNAVMGSHRAVGEKHVSILDDHDHVFGKKIRFSAEAASPNQVAAAVGIQLFTLGIPCIYYGTDLMTATCAKHYLVRSIRAKMDFPVWIRQRIPAMKVYRGLVPSERWGITALILLAVPTYAFKRWRRRARNFRRCVLAANICVRSLFSVIHSRFMVTVKSLPGRAFSMTKNF
jgi:glycosidase